MDHKYQSNSAGPKTKSAFTQEEREALIVKYAYLVKYVANRMALKIPSNVLYDELVSAGSVGLIDAIDKFDPGRDVSIKTYAEYRIKGAIIDELRHMDWYTRSMRKKIQDIEQAIKSVETRENRPADDDEIAEALGLELDKYYRQLSDIYSATLLSMDEFIRDGDNQSSSKRSFTETLASPDDPHLNVQMEEMKHELAKTITTLTHKEQLVISLYYYDELTLKEIGEVLDLTESRICQIHTAALIKLKTRLNSKKSI